MYGKLERGLTERIFDSEGAFELVFETLPLAVLMLDRNYMIVRASNHAVGSFGYSSVELLESSVDKLVPGLVCRLQAGRRYARANLSLLREEPDYLVKCKDGSERDVELEVVESASAEPEYYLVYLKERSRREQCLKELMQQKEDYVAMLTHDLKAPILAANRALKFLLDKEFGELSKAQTDLITNILESNNDMYEMLRTLLEVYKHDGGKKKLLLQSHDLCILLESVATQFKPLAEAKSIVILLGLPAKEVLVDYDQDETRRVLQNLLDNALKFTDSGGTVKIRVDDNQSHVLVAVEDSGSGISEHCQKQLFQRFWQAPANSRIYAGTGLGLYLCRKIIELHGGKIWCESELNKGSVFYFTLPR